MTQDVPRRLVMGGLGLPLVASAGLGAFPGVFRRDQVPPDDLGADAASLGVPRFTEGHHDMVVTPATRDALAQGGVSFVPASGSTAVPDAALPSMRTVLSVASAALDLLVGVVHFDGGFALVDGQGEDACVEAPGLTFRSFTSQLADGMTTSSMWQDGEPGDRVPTFTFDLAGSPIGVEGTTLTLQEYDLFLAPEAAAAVQERYPQLSLPAEEPFATGSAQGTFEPLTDSPVS